ncbi:hypothetical protein M8J77_002868 [Diaphorina citri]|nr:hypothetical protein M8J77_002868 [Diaphorina citri]
MMSMMTIYNFSFVIIDIDDNSDDFLKDTVNNNDYFDDFLADILNNDDDSIADTISSDDFLANTVNKNDYFDDSLADINDEGILISLTMTQETSTASRRGGTEHHRGMVISEHTFIITVKTETKTTETESPLIH